MRHLLVCNALGFESLLLDHADVPALGVHVEAIVKTGHWHGCFCSAVTFSPQRNHPCHTTSTLLD